MKKTYWIVGGVIIVAVISLIAFSSPNLGNDKNEVDETNTSMLQDEMNSDAQNNDTDDNRLEDSSDNNENNEKDSNEDSQPDLPQDEMSQMPGPTFPLKADLVSVNDTLDGYNFSTSSGKAYLNLEKRTGIAIFENLPELTDDFFYEGWVVNTATSEFISTGKVDKINNVWTNTFTYDESEINNYNRYVLTLEPNDNDPAPAGHVVEANFVPVVEN